MTRSHPIEKLIYRANERHSRVSLINFNKHNCSYIFLMVYTHTHAHGPTPIVKGHMRKHCALADPACIHIYIVQYVMTVGQCLREAGEDIVETQGYCV